MCGDEDRMREQAQSLIHLVLLAPSPDLNELSVVLDPVGGDLLGPAGGVVRSIIAGDGLVPPSYQLIGTRFPEFGLYADIDPLDLAHETPVAGDAVDDRVDLVAQMQRFEAIASDAGVEAALYDLHLLAPHWLTHLVD